MVVDVRSGPLVKFFWVPLTAAAALSFSRDPNFKPELGPAKRCEEKHLVSMLAVSIW